MGNLLTGSLMDVLQPLDLANLYFEYREKATHSEIWHYPPTRKSISNGKRAMVQLERVLKVEN